LILSGCTGGLECLGYSQKRFKEICEDRTVKLQLHTDSAYQAMLKNCLNNIESESAYAIKAKAKYESIIGKANQDKLLRKEYESERSDWEEDEARQAKGWQLNPIHFGSSETPKSSEYSFAGMPLLDFEKRAIYSSYAAWLEGKKFKREVEATGWNSISSDMKVFAENAKCKE